jgi:hypothetical protein
MANVLADTALILPAAFASADPRGASTMAMLTYEKQVNSIADEMLNSGLQFCEEFSGS